MYQYGSDTFRAPLPVGSMQWINDENAQVDRHCEQEAEDFGFSARNELEWLNEHMADIFAKDHVYVLVYLGKGGADSKQKCY